ncbi:GntR family transcriptional regulator [Kiloniella sp. EL199]|uniref:GntR family transcriptional regulator n=1 Tax=Kiloniella sp. EL199 TaxID=2107581 RepID=UPI000EA1FA83|nr:GntR family transcriptional regulator [Kiloniella sp. EL199]
MNANSLTIEETPHTVQSIHDAILERICLLDFHPGQQLKEADLAAEFGVSRTPIRDALSRITHLNLIETRNGVGTVVKELSNQKIADVYTTRLELAPLIGTLSTTEITPVHLDRIQDLILRAKNLEVEKNSRSYVLINHELHQLLCDLISNSVLRSFWRQAYYQAASVWYRIFDIAGEDSIPSLINELTELQSALKNQDLIAVGHIQRIYIGYGYTRIQQYLFDNKTK